LTGLGGAGVPAGDAAEGGKGACNDGSFIGAGFAGRRAETPAPLPSSSQPNISAARPVRFIRSARQAAVDLFGEFQIIIGDGDAVGRPGDHATAAGGLAQIDDVFHPAIGHGGKSFFQKVECNSVEQKSIRILGKSQQISAKMKIAFR
jgi:hypothetical protein